MDVDFNFVLTIPLHIILFQDKVLTSWIAALCNGLNNPSPAFTDVFQYLLPNCVRQNQELISAVPDTSANGHIYDGAVLCLVYGYLDTQVRRARNRSRQRDVPVQNLEHRFLLRKRCGRSRTRTSSDSDDGDDDEKLYQNVTDNLNPTRVVNLHDLLTDPARHLIESSKLHVYFEAHNPDYLILKHTRVSDADYHECNKTEYEVKVVVKIASYKKFSGCDLLDLISESVEHCVESCLGAFSCNQDLMYGLVVVIDGFVLIKVKKQNQGGQEEYRITETDLITWDNADSLHAMLYTLNGIL